uniref:C3H1-type domain-containing protein n=1 Tax=Kalanchoe fedtschenkoi TaxID=63787 RepID=A0A7N0U8X5_KALFE
MPLGKYYCDYCDKEFQDTPYARKRHLQGLQHQRARSIWYNSFKDPSQLCAEGFGAGVCNRFVKTGFCAYGDSCKYLHPKTDNFPGQVPHALDVGFAVCEFCGLS